MDELNDQGVVCMILCEINSNSICSFLMQIVFSR